MSPTPNCLYAGWMARTHSWLPRLHEIRRTVAGSTRSHYTRAELQDLFQLQQSPTQRLMDAMPTVRMNMGLLVERDALVSFLDLVRDTDDVTGLMKKLRADKRAPSRRNLRSFVRREFGQVSFDGMPENLKIERGNLSIQFDTLDELVETEFYVAKLLQDELEEFARRYEPIPEKKADVDVEEVKRMFEALKS